MTWLIGEEGPTHVIRAPSGPRGPIGPQGPVGPGVAATVTYDDSLTGLGGATVQQAIVALVLIIAALRAAQLDFTNPNQSGLLALGV
jgi:hypothetical protein